MESQSPTQPAGDAEAAYTQAVELVKQKDFAKAVELLNSAIAAKPKEAKFHAEKGAALLEQAK